MLPVGPVYKLVAFRLASASRTRYVPVVPYGGTAFMTDADPVADSELESKSPRDPHSSPDGRHKVSALIVGLDPVVHTSAN